VKWLCRSADAPPIPNFEVHELVLRRASSAPRSSLHQVHDDEDDGFVGKCWHCGDTFSFRIGKGWTRGTSVVKGNRSLSPGTLAQLDVGSGTAFFPDTDRKLPAVYFNYAKGKKARSFPEKHFVSGDGFKRSFWKGMLERDTTDLERAAADAWI
jgi:hypothetical protein